MKEFFLGRFFSGDELDIIHQQHIIATIFFTKSLGGVAADGVDQIVGKLFRRNIQHGQAAPLTSIPTA